MTKITTQSEKFARLIRDELGPFNDEDKSVVSLIRELVDRLASTSPAPDGWVLVPREPTAEMYIAGAKAVDGRRQNRAQICYAAMIDAAPQPVVEKENG